MLKELLQLSNIFSNKLDNLGNSSDMKDVISHCYSKNVTSIWLPARRKNRVANHSKIDLGAVKRHRVVRHSEINVQAIRINGVASHFGMDKKDIEKNRIAGHFRIK